MAPIRVAIAGVGNCASAFIQGLSYYAEHDQDGTGLMHPEIGGYKVTDVVPVAAFDVDARKVGLDLAEAILQPPNCTMNFQQVPPTGVTVQMGPIHDGVPSHLASFVRPGSQPPVDVAQVLSDTHADVLINLLPTGSALATRAYADAAIKAKVSFINGIPEMIASDPDYDRAAAKAGIVLVGDDFKSQIGTTILHRALLRTCVDRGVSIEKMHQYNFAGNTDFANLERRGETKEVTKRSALREVLPNQPTWGFAPMFIDGQEDIKTGVIHIEGRYWGNNLVKIDTKLEVNDSADAGGVIIDMIRFAQTARKRGRTGVLREVCAFYAKHPPVPMPDDAAIEALEKLASTK